jgi:hypothetical protein
MAKKDIINARLRVKALKRLINMGIDTRTLNAFTDLKGLFTTKALKVILGDDVALGRIVAGDNIRMIAVRADRNGFVSATRIFPSNGFGRDVPRDMRRG